MTNPEPPLITVITVCRNSLDMLKLTAASVKNQSLDNYEYIIVDGASTDGTPAYLASGKSGADKYVSEPDKGIYDAMNKGAQMASGKWVVYMNAGDTFVDNDTLLHVSRHLVQTEAGVVYGDALLRKTDGSLRLKTASEPKNRHRMFFHHQSAYIRRDLQLKFPFRLDVGLSGDYCFFKECLLSGVGMTHVSEPWCVYDCSGASSINRRKVLKQNIKIIRRFDKLANRLKFLPRLYFVVIYSAIRGRKS